MAQGPKAPAPRRQASWGHLDKPGPDPMPQATEDPGLGFAFCTKEGNTGPCLPGDLRRAAKANHRVSGPTGPSCLRSISLVVFRKMWTWPPA